MCINRGRQLYKTEVKREATLAVNVPARPQFISAESRDFQLGLGVCAEVLGLMWKMKVSISGTRGSSFLREQNRKRPFVPTLFCPQVTIAKLYPAKEKGACWWRKGDGSRGEGGEIEIEMKRANGWEFTSMIKAHWRVLKAAPLLEAPPPWWYPALNHLLWARANSQAQRTDLFQNLLDLLHISTGLNANRKHLFLNSIQLHFLHRTHSKQPEECFTRWKHQVSDTKTSWKGQ